MHSKASCSPRVGRGSPWGLGGFWGCGDAAAPRIGQWELWGAQLGTFWGERGWDWGHGVVAQGGNTLGRDMGGNSTHGSTEHQRGVREGPAVLGGHRGRPWSWSHGWEGFGGASEQRGAGVGLGMPRSVYGVLGGIEGGL